MAPLVLAALLSGCLLEGHCGYMPEEAQWVEPGLYAQLSEGRVGVWQAQWSPGDGALPLDGAALGAPGLRLKAVSADMPGRMSMRMDRDGWVSAWIADDEAHLAAARFQAFAANVSAAPADAVAHAATRFGASAGDVDLVEASQDGTGGWTERPFRRYFAAMPGPMRLQDLAAAIDLEAMQASRPGHLSGQAHNMSWEFTVPTWTIAMHPGTVTVDSNDHVAVEGAFSEGDDGQEVQDAVRELFAEAGLPQPRLEGMQHTGSIC